ncbi:hypothetical protein HNR60_004204 [Rhodopseudomonas rhenobacensis]|uniref:Uncharacterized protein n=1 Tax=Rhodopseudomonas rhenobacensis TaxID=87461 RepID=A0A7W7Z7G2_9BRAD|nr:hypothetical protein [Rhodopseudomonas rhenobacensis]MBB5049426.1 hypothetical protein [Rhodopseudomonas rhenobacensis]
MNMKRTLNDLVRAVVDEAERNTEFARRIDEALGIQEKPKKPALSRAAHRRAPAAIDPIELARQGEPVLRARLAELDLEQLKDVVADYGMDPGKLVLKWKAADRIIDRIVEVSVGRARKGEGFLSSESPRSE